MPHYRSRKEEKVYIKYLKRRRKSDAKCQFCDISDEHKPYINETKHFLVIRNLFPYSIWDGRRVTDHLMIVPKQHTETLNSLGEDAAVEYVKLVSKYEHDGYNVYARAPDSIIKSVPHQHTHLIKTTGKAL